MMPVTIRTRIRGLFNRFRNIFSLTAFRNELMVFLPKIDKRSLASSPDKPFSRSVSNRRIASDDDRCQKFLFCISISKLWTVQDSRLLYDQVYLFNLLRVK